MAVEQYADRSSKQPRDEQAPREGAEHELRPEPQVALDVGRNNRERVVQRAPRGDLRDGENADCLP
jgi:hypothetical protein